MISMIYFGWFGKQICKQNSLKKNVNAIDF